MLIGIKKKLLSLAPIGSIAATIEWHGLCLPNVLLLHSTLKQLFGHKIIGFVTDRIT